MVQVVFLLVEAALHVNTVPRRAGLPGQGTGNLLKLDKSTGKMLTPKT